jgi:hypothetical protein
MNAARLVLGDWPRDALWFSGGGGGGGGGGLPAPYPPHLHLRRPELGMQALEGHQRLHEALRSQTYSQ